MHHVDFFNGVSDVPPVKNVSHIGQGNHGVGSFEFPQRMFNARPDVIKTKRIIFVGTGRVADCNANLSYATKPLRPCAHRETADNAQ